MHMFKMPLNDKTKIILATIKMAKSLNAKETSMELEIKEKENKFFEVHDFEIVKYVMSPDHKNNVIFKCSYISTNMFEFHLVK